MPNLVNSSISTADQPVNEPVKFAYSNGELSWKPVGRLETHESHSEGVIKDASVVCVFEEAGRTLSFTICSQVETSESKSDSYPSIAVTRAANLPPPFLEKHLVPEIPRYLDATNGEVYVLISTQAGTGKAETYFANVLQPILAASGLTREKYDLIKTESNESIKYFTVKTLRERAEKGIQQTVLLLSGDGGVVDIINGLIKDTPQPNIYVRPAIVLFPLGTGNALFNSIQRVARSAAISHLSEPSDSTLALRSLFHGSRCPLPIFSATFSSAVLLSNEGRTATPIPSGSLYGAVVASYGFHSTLVADSDTAEYRKHGDQRFGMVAKELLTPADGNLPHSYKARLTLRKPRETTTTLEEQTVDRQQHGYILATMVSNLEKTFTISPASQPLDGNMRVIHFGPLPADKVMQIMGRAYDGGKHIEDISVSYSEIDSMRVDFQENGKDGRWRRVCIDGSIVRVEESGWMEIRKVKDHVLDVVL